MKALKFHFAVVFLTIFKMDSETNNMITSGNQVISTIIYPPQYNTSSGGYRKFVGWGVKFLKIISQK